MKLPKPNAGLLRRGGHDQSIGCELNASACLETAVDQLGGRKCGLVQRWQSGVTCCAQQLAQQPRPLAYVVSELIANTKIAGDLRNRPTGSGERPYLIRLAHRLDPRRSVSASCQSLPFAVRSVTSCHKASISQNKAFPFDLLQPFEKVAD